MRVDMGENSAAVSEVATLFDTYDRAIGAAAKHEAVERLFDELRLSPGIYVDA